jgi:hypothetical protein
MDSLNVFLATYSLMFTHNHELAVGRVDHLEIQVQGQFKPHIEVRRVNESPVAFIGLTHRF